MDDRKKEGSLSVKWALITQHPWLPSRADQIAQAHEWGVKRSEVEGMDVSAIVEDDVRKVKRTTNWPGKLTERAEWISKLTASTREYGAFEGDQVFFATPLCIGFSSTHARDTIEALWACGVSVYVHSLKRTYADGDDLTELLAKVAADANAAHQRAHRRRQS